VARRRAAPADDPRRPEGLGVAAAREIVEYALAVHPEGAALPLSAAEALLRSYGISVSAGRAITSLSAAEDAADSLGYPVALKAAGIVRRGRSERAGVALDLHGAAELRRAWEGMSEELGAAAMVEVVVQTMAPPGAEVRVAVEPHHALGPVVTFGLGGVLADAIGDRVPRLVPFATGDAAAMIAASRASRALADDDASRAAVADLVERVACLADDLPELDTLLINPALASREGAWVVDVTAHVRPAPEPADAVRRLV
jgi:succinyl-CoA synthetase beta subunit